MAMIIRNQATNTVLHLTVMTRKPSGYEYQPSPYGYDKYDKKPSYDYSPPSYGYDKKPSSYEHQPYSSYGYDKKPSYEYSPPSYGYDKYEKPKSYGSY